MVNKEFKYFKIPLKIPVSASVSGSAKKSTQLLLNHTPHLFKNFIKIRRQCFEVYRVYHTSISYKHKLHDGIDDGDVSIYRPFFSVHKYNMKWTG